MAKKFGKRYMQTKKAIYTMYDVISLVVVILSFDKLITSKTRTVEPKQVARLIEKIPKIKMLLYDSAPWWAFDDMDIKSK